MEEKTSRIFGRVRGKAQTMRNIGIGRSPRLRVLHRVSIALDNSVKAYLEVARIHAVHRFLSIYEVMTKTW